MLNEQKPTEKIIAPGVLEYLGREGLGLTPPQDMTEAEMRKQQESQARAEASEVSTWVPESGLHGLSVMERLGTKDLGLTPPVVITEDEMRQHHDDQAQKQSAEVSVWR